MQMQIQLCGDAGGIAIDKGEPCRFPKLQECAHFHYERVQLCPLQIYMQTNPTDLSLHSQHEDPSEEDWYTVQVTSNDECWLLKRSYDNFVKLDSQLHQCIYDRKISQLPELTHDLAHDKIEETLNAYLQRFCKIVDNSLNCGPVLTWFQLDNKGHRLLVPNEESDSINTPAVAAAYSIKKYVSQARDELNLEVGDMISVIDMASPGESMWWRGKRGFQVGFFPQHCVHVIGEKLACLPHAPLALGSTASPIKPVLRKHGKLVAFFRNFILNRPSRRRLKQSGILKERVFGCDLGEHLLNSGHEIPMVLKCCAEFIESHGLVDGIYRLSGVTSNIQKLRNAFDEDRIPNLYTEDILQDIHSVASLLKMYFRELPNPLCTYQLYHSFVSAVQGSIDSSGGRNKINENERLLRMREVVHKLPPPHYRTLEYLMRHLARVAKHGARTGMTSRNVAIVWAPNLLRCAELEVGGVAALQGVGVQAVVTEFLVCYTDLIFCENPPAMQLSIEEPSSLSPRKLRPKSLAISTPTKLLTLEEARSKHLLNKSEECNYIEVGGGPKNLPEKYHTVLELPQGFRKRGFSKRSPSGWRSFFSKSRNSTTHGSLSKNLRKASTPGIVIEKSLSVEPDLNVIKRKLRPVKSAESLTSGQSEVVSCEIDVLGPLTCLTKPTGHNRSVSHDSYFDTLQTSNHNSEGSLLDLSEIQLNFELEESEMRIFSEDESLVSSPRVQKEKVQKKVLSRVYPENMSNTPNSNNPSPKKQARIVNSPDSQSRKRSRLEDQLSDILYIDCNTPENAVCTTAIIHSIPESNSFEDKALTVEPRNKSPRNSDEISPLDVRGTRGELSGLDVKKYQFTGRSKNRNSLNLESRQCIESVLPKSLTEYNIHGALQIPDSVPSEVNSTNLTPQTPNYKRLIGETDSSDTNTPNQISPDFSLTESPTDISYVNLNRFSGESQKFDELAMADKKDDAVPSNTYENVIEDLTDRLPASPTYENVLTTISITYKSPTKSKSFDIPLTKDGNIYEDVDINAEMKAQIPTSVANLPSKEARQPDLVFSGSKVTNLDEALSQQQNDSSSSKSISASIQSLSSTCVDGQCCGSAHGSRSSIVLDSCCSLTTKCTDINDSDTQLNLSRNSNENIYENVSSPKSALCSPVKSPISVNGGAEKRASFDGTSLRNVNTNEKRKSCETEGCNDEDAIYQQVKYFRRSIHEINELLDKPFTVAECKNTSSSVGNLTVANNIKEIKKGSNSLQNLNSTKSVDNSVNNVNKTEVIVSQNMSEDRDTPKIDLSNDLLDQNIILDKQESEDKITENDIKQNAIQEDGLMSKENGEIKSVDQIVDEKDFVVNNDSCNNTEVCEKMVARIVKDDSSVVENKIDEDNAEDNSEKFDSLEINNSEINESCNGKQNLNEESLSNRSDEDKCKSSASLPNSRKQSLQSSKTGVYSATLNVRELATKFEQIDSNNDGILVRHKNDVFSGRDSLPPCLRAKHAKLTKNNSRARSLDENAFVKEFGNSSQHSKKVSIIESLSRRKSLDERLNRIGTSQPKLLNQPKKLPDIGTVAPEIHLSHSRQSLETVNTSRTKISEAEDKKTTAGEHSSTSSLSDLGESKSNAASADHSACDAAPSLTSSVVSDCHSDNPQLNRERIEKYKEERRNFLREKYRSESFRADKDELLSRLKQKSKTKLDSESSDVATDSLEYSDIVDSASDNLTKCRIDKSDYCSDQSRYKRPSDKSSDSYKKSTSFSNRFSTDIYSKNTDTVDDKKLDTKQAFSNQRLKKNYRLNTTEQEAVQKSVKTKANDEIASECLDTSIRLTQQGKENMLHDLQFKNVDGVKAVSSEKSRNILHRRVGDSTESPFLRRKESDSARRKDSEKSAVGDIRTARGHSFDLMSRERDLDTERNRKISLESRLSSRSPKKEKRSPSYCIKDMTAMFESKSNQS